MARESVHEDNWPHTFNNHERKTLSQNPCSLKNSSKEQSLTESRLRMVDNSVGKYSEIKQNELSTEHVQHQACVSNLSSETTCVKQPHNQISNNSAEPYSGKHGFQGHVSTPSLTNICLRQPHLDNEQSREIMPSAFKA